MRQISVIFALFLFQGGISFDDEDYGEVIPTHEPHLMSTAISVEAAVGESVTFPCDVDDLGDYILLWKRGNNMLLFVDDLRITRDDRIRTNYTSLHIANIEPKDTGEYVCLISTSKPTELRHTLNVLQPPTVISTSPKNDFITVKEGDPVRLMCEVTGNPTPTITWRHTNEGRMMKIYENRIIIAEALQKDAGDYECIANNSLGISTSTKIRVQVSSAPKVHMSHSRIHARIGDVVNITCVVEGKPSPTVIWRKDYGQTIYPTDRYHLKVLGHSHTIIIDDIQEQDFGTYECFAINTVSDTIGSTHLIEKPMEIYTTSSTSLSYSFTSLLIFASWIQYLH